MAPDKIVHVLSTGSGGVNDFVDLLCAGSDRFSKHSLSEEGASRWAFSGDVVLHYVGYGYAKRGAPLWLLNKLRRERGAIRKLVVWFHELYAFGPPWGSAFWLSPLQKYIADELFGLADEAITNRLESSAWLCRKTREKRCSVIPVPSNVGEVNCFSGLSRDVVTVFGGRFLREKTYRALFGSEGGFRGFEGVIHDIGPQIADPKILDLIRKAGVVEHGALPAREVSRILSRSIAGLVDYPVRYVAKSGVFAAYASHGVCPVLFDTFDGVVDGLKSNVHFLTGSGFSEKVDGRFSDIGLAAWSWYQGHGLKKHVSMLEALFV